MGRDSDEKESRARPVSDQRQELVVEYVIRAELSRRGSSYRLGSFFAVTQPNL